MTMRKIPGFSLVSRLELTSGIVFVVSVSCLLSIVSNQLHVSDDSLSLDSSVLLKGHVHKLFTYCFHHKDMKHLFLSVAVLVFCCSGLEKGVGTVRFLYMLLLLVTSVGLLHVLLELLLFSPSTRTSVSGLIPLSLAVLSLVTISSRMRKAFLLGISVPTAVVPWLLMLIVSLLIPNTVFFCNVLAVVTGQTYGMKWFSVLELSESKACVLEKKVPFRLMKKMRVGQFVPASAEERKKILHTICNPPPGSYPVQAYAPTPVLASPATGSALNNALAFPLTGSAPEGKIHSNFLQTNYPIPYSGNHFGPRFESVSGHGHTHECRHGHGHSHQHQGVSSWMSMMPHAHSHFGTPVNMPALSSGNFPHATAQAAISEASMSGGNSVMSS